VFNRSPDAIVAEIERGAAMAEALDNPSFNEAIDHLTSFHLAAMVACRPGYASDQEALNHHHALHHAIIEVVAQMTQWRQTGEAAARALEWTREHGEND
jgi:hypothetical protein